MTTTDNDIPLRVTVELPQPIRLEPRRSIALIVGAAQMWVEVDGDGNVTVKHNGDPLYSINVITAARLTEEATTRMRQAR